MSPDRPFRKWQFTDQVCHSILVSRVFCRVGNRTAGKQAVARDFFNGTLNLRRLDAPGGLPKRTQLPEASSLTDGTTQTFNSASTSCPRCTAIV